jgi:hypothetical protein
MGSSMGPTDICAPLLQMIGMFQVDYGWSLQTNELGSNFARDFLI